MPNGALLAEGREAEVFLLADGRVLKLMREASSSARVQREAAVCLLLNERGIPAPVVHDVVTVDQRPGLVMDRIDGTDLLHTLGPACHEDGGVSPNHASQYTTESNLRARQRLWEEQRPRFDIVSWVLDVAELRSARRQRVLDAGCGNGMYLRELRRLGILAVGCDLSEGMLAAAGPHRRLVHADVTRLPFATPAFDVVLAPHMLYHVADRRRAVTEMRRVLKAGGRCVVVTNGQSHVRALHDIVEKAVRVATPGWQMRTPSTEAFSLENGEAQLRVAFERVDCVRPEDVAPVTLTDAAIAADYVASVADHYEHETARPWHDVVDAVRNAVQREIDANGAFNVCRDIGAFICS